MRKQNLSTLQQLSGKTIRSASMHLDARSDREHIEDIVMKFTDGTLLEIVIDADAGGHSEPLRSEVMLFLRDAVKVR